MEPNSYFHSGSLIYTWAEEALMWIQGAEKWHNVGLFHHLIVLVLFHCCITGQKYPLLCTVVDSSLAGAVISAGKSAVRD